METLTITVKSAKRTEGVNKKGNPWKRTTIKATDGNFYATFKDNIPDAALAVGTVIKLRATKSSAIANTYDIDSIIEYANPTNASTPPEGAPDRPPKGGHPDIACAP